MVPGAKLRQRMVQLGEEQGLDVPAYIQESGYQFSQLIRQVSTVRIDRVLGSDILVGLHGASKPRWVQVPIPARGGLRRDLYLAFTRMTTEPFVYLPHSDKFVTADLSEGESIKIAKVSHESLISDRRTFVKTLPLDEQRPFLDALNHPTNPLTQFRDVIIEHSKINHWISAHADQLRSRITQWAKDNQITPRDTWFRKSQGTISPHRTLIRIVPYLSEDEIRDLRIPFRAIEALLADSTKDE